MSLVLGILPIGVGFAVGAAAAAGVGLGAVGQTVGAVVGAVALSVIWEFSPLPWVVGMFSGPQSSAGFWGFQRGENE
jgi:hypothetical protein